ncbi:MAG: hypothetical protein JTT17_07850 [Candidatus Brockarchaeota archaeon]|nr:hypothetical protein [Candidatus Brockarchaeota archaeon]
MVSLLDRELKFLFTSPLFIGLELIPVMLITILDVAGQDFKGPLLEIIPSNLLPIVWLMIIFYSTYFELELWRKTFLNKNAKLRVYASSSPYTPFLMHCIASLVLLELKTLVFILPYLLRQQLSNLPLFLAATHVNWFFSISVGTILSKDVFNKMADSAANFLCILIFSVIALLIINAKIDSKSVSLAQYWPALVPSSNEVPPELITAVIFLISLVLFAIAVYANSSIAKRLLLGDP